MPRSICDLPLVTGERVIHKRWLSVDDNTRPPKQLCVKGPPVHSRSFLVETILEWKVNNKIKKIRARLLLDSGCTGPILAKSFIERNGIPVEIKKKRRQVVASNGIEVEGGTHNTKSLGVWMGKHVREMKFKSIGIREEAFGLVGYLPMTWLVQHNPDIDWTLWKIKWQSEYCRKHCLPSKIKIEWMTEEEMLREPKEQCHVFGMAVFHKEDGEVLYLPLIDHYKNYAEIFSEEKIHALPEHSKYDHKIELKPSTVPPFGPIYPLSESELRVLRKYVDEMLASEKIVRSTSPAAAPILFVPKPDSTLRLCKNYRGLNKITIKK